MFEIHKNNKLAREFSVKHATNAEVFHSSGFGKVQSGENIGTASIAATMATRKSIEEQRKYVRKYNNSKIVSATYGLRHAESYTPRTEGGAGALYDRSGASQARIDSKTYLRETASRDPKTFLRKVEPKKPAK